MSTSGRPTPQRSPALTGSKQRKAEARAQHEATVRVRQTRRITLVGLVVAIVALALVLHALQGSSSDLVQLDNSQAAGAGLAWSPAGTQIALSGPGGRGIAIRDGRSGELLQKLSTGANLAEDVDWSRSGGWIAVANSAPPGSDVRRATMVDLWRSAGWTRAPAHLPSRGTPAYHLAFSPDGTRLAVQTSRQLGLLAVPSLKPIAAFSNPYTTANSTYPIAWAPNGTILALGLGDTTGNYILGIRMLDGHTLVQRRLITIGSQFPANEVGSMAWSPDSRKLAIASGGGQITIYDPNTGRKLRTLQHGLNAVTAMAWSPDGKRIAVGGANGMGIWDPTNGHLLRYRDAAVDVPGSHYNVNVVQKVAWSPDSTRLAISGTNALPKVWSLPADLR